MSDYLTSFTQGYVAAALWSSTASGAPEDDGEGCFDTSFLNYGCDESDIAPETLEAMAADCADFVAANKPALVTYHAITGRPADHAGHDFWLTRNRHGAGFWDRGAGKTGEALTESSKPYGSVYLYFGDDGMIHG